MRCVLCVVWVDDVMVVVVLQLVVLTLNPKVVVVKGPIKTGWHGYGRERRCRMHAREPENTKDAKPKDGTCFFVMCDHMRLCRSPLQLYTVTTVCGSRLKRSQKGDKRRDSSSVLTPLRARPA